MRWFRRKAGRHALGAAVTSIPSGPRTLPGPVGAAPAVVAAPVRDPDVMRSIATLLATGEAWAEPAPPTPSVAVRPPAPAQLPAEPAGAQPVPTPAPRVQLGFRDGTSTALDPSSSQSLALQHLAQSLTRRD